MLSKTVTLTNGSGLHMRPAGVFATAMGEYDSDVTIVAGDKEVNGKSLMAIVAAGIKCGAEIEIKVEGSDEKDAFDKAVSLVEGGLGE